MICFVGRYGLKYLEARVAVNVTASLFSPLQPHLFISLLPAGSRACNPSSVVLLRRSTQYLIDLQYFSPLLGGGPALGGGAILVFRAVILHERYQQLKGQKTRNATRLCSKREKCGRRTCKRKLSAGWDCVRFITQVCTVTQHLYLLPEALRQELFAFCVS